MAAKKPMKRTTKKKPAAKTTTVKNPFGGTMQKGGLHKSLGVPQGQKIPASRIAAAAAGANGPKAQKQARMAQSLAKIRGGK